MCRFFMKKVQIYNVMLDSKIFPYYYKCKNMERRKGYG